MNGTTVEYWSNGVLGQQPHPSTTPPLHHSSTPPLHSARSAFTLVEVTLAMAVAAVALMGLLAMATMGMRYGRLAVDDTMTGTIAQDLFAEWRVKDFPLPADIRWYNRDGGPSGLADALYQCQIRVYDSAPTGFVKTVELVFVWPKVNDFAASPRTNRYFTNVSRLDYPN